MFKRLLKDLKDKSQTKGKHFQNAHLTKDLNLEYIKHFQNKAIRKENKQLIKKQKKRATDISPKRYTDGK